MARTSILSDRLLRELMAVGQVDLMIAIPTRNNAPSIEDIVTTTLRGEATFYPRERNVLLVADFGSLDGTPDVVDKTSLDRAETVQMLRTMHRVTARGFRSKNDAMHAILAAADLLQSRALIVLDPNITSIKEDWLMRLARPVLEQNTDFVARRYARGPLEGPLITQLIRPLFAATFRHQLEEPVGGEFACSQRFVAHCLARREWVREPTHFGVDPWLVSTALVGGFSVAQAFLGPHVSTPRTDRPSLTGVFTEVVGSLFACLGLFEEYWRDRGERTVVQTFGTGRASTSPARANVSSMMKAFHSAVPSLDPVLAKILQPETLAAIRELAIQTVVASESGEMPSEALPMNHFPDALWARTVFDFVSAYHHEVMNRSHMAQALVPLYLGRAASFLSAHEGSDEDETWTAIDRLAAVFDEERSYLLARWGGTSIDVGADAAVADHSDKNQRSGSGSGSRSSSGLGSGSGFRPRIGSSSRRDSGSANTNTAENEKQDAHAKIGGKR